MYYENTKLKFLRQIYNIYIYIYIYSKTIHYKNVGRTVEILLITYNQVTISAFPRKENLKDGGMFYVSIH